MTVETATYISDFNTAKPDETDPKSEGDNHLRLIKSVLQSTFPNVAGAVAPTNTTQIATTAFVHAVTSGLVTGPLTFSTVNVAGPTAATSGQCRVLTYAGATTIKLPATQSLGNRVGIVVANSRTDNVVQRNGKPIMGLAEDITITDPYAAFELVYIDATRGWMML